MPITHAFSYMVHPRKGDPDAKTINGAAVPLEGKMFGLLSEVYEKSDKECDIDISFNASPDGKQANPCRSLVQAFAKNPSVEAGREIAHRLRKATDGRSGPGLLFLIFGTDGDAHKLLISRFPADSGILAEEKASGLQLDFLEKIFLKNAHSYKAALYRHVSIDAGFWDARAVDRQISSSVVLASEYWVNDFLASDFRTTSAAGTLRLANALKAAVRNVKNPETMAEIVSVGTLLKNMAGQKLSIDSIKSKYSLSDTAFESIKAALKNPETASEQFVFNYGEFVEHIPFRSIILNNGVTITAPFEKFENSIRETSREKDGTATYSVRGKIVDQKLQKAF